jgi:hypothetical protein
MSKYKSYTETVEIDVCLDDWEDEELIEEIKARGYKVEEESDLTDVEQYWNRGDKKEALILLEREYRGLRGISEILN